MGSLYLFTWNLKEKRDAYNLALQHLTKKGQSGLFVACIQEAPGKTEILAARKSTNSKMTRKAIADLTSKGVAVVKAPASQKRLPKGLALLYHPTLGVEAEYCDEDREFFAAIFRDPGQGKRIAVIGLHGWAKVDVEEPQEHGACRALLRHEINAIAALWTCDHVIVLGDWNSAVEAVEVSSWHCFYALRGEEDRPLDEPDKKRRRGLEHAPLYVVRPANTLEDGTLRKNDSGKNSVKLVDFIAVDEASRRLATSQILTDIMSQAVWDSTSATKDLSDHRPVEGSLNI